MAPKVFISHASEDKERFVSMFAEALRGAGIEAGLTSGSCDQVTA